MKTEIQASLSYLLVLVESTLSLSHIGFTETLGDEETFQMMENMVECFKLVLKSIRLSSVVFSDPLKKSVSEIYTHILQVLLDLTSDGSTLSPNVKERLKKIRTSLESANKDDSGDEFTCDIKPCF